MKVKIIPYKFIYSERNFFAPTSLFSPYRIGLIMLRLERLVSLKNLFFSLRQFYRGIALYSFIFSVFFSVNLFAFIENNFEKRPFFDISSDFSINNFTLDNPSSISYLKPNVNYSSFLFGAGFDNVSYNDFSLIFANNSENSFINGRALYFVQENINDLKIYHTFFSFYKQISNYYLGANYIFSKGNSSLVRDNTSYEIFSLLYKFKVLDFGYCLLLENNSSYNESKYYFILKLKQNLFLNYTKQIQSYDNIRNENENYSILFAPFKAMKFFFKYYSDGRYNIGLNLCIVNNSSFIYNFVLDNKNQNMIYGMGGYSD